MPQLAKGAKWIYGWVVVGPGRRIRIPPEAYAEYDFRFGEQVLFLPGSKTSGGFGIGRCEVLARAATNLSQRAIGRGAISENEQIALPSEIDVAPGDRLLAARGSGKALGFVQRGSIYAEALEHPEIEVFRV